MPDMPHPHPLHPHTPADLHARQQIGTQTRRDDRDGRGVVSLLNRGWRHRNYSDNAGQYRPCKNRSGHDTIIIGTLIVSNGTKHYAFWCTHPRHDQPLRGPSVPHQLINNHAQALSLDIDDIPVIRDHSCAQCGGDGCNLCQSSNPCERCGGYQRIERHHWAPRHLFTDADRWPMSNLCRQCHMEWHHVVTPHMNRKTA